MTFQQTEAEQVVGKRKVPSDNSPGSMFMYYRTLCDLVGDIPFGLISIGSTLSLVVSSGKQVLVLDVETLNILFSFPGWDVPVISVASIRDIPIALTSDGVVRSLYRDRVNDQLVLPGFNNSDFVSMRSFENQLFILLRRQLFILDDKITTINQVCFPKDVHQGEATCITQLPGYRDKAVIGFKDGELVLLNFKTPRIIYVFSNCRMNEAVLCMEASRAPNVVAVGTRGGQVWICDLLRDRKLFSVSCGEGLSCLDFYSDPVDDAHDLLAVGMLSGEIFLYNLFEQSLRHKIEAHDGSIVSLRSLANQPVLVSAGADNTIKEWALGTNGMYLLKGRTGLASTPLALRFYEDNAIISLGREGIPHYCSLIKDSQSLCFSGTDHILKTFEEDTSSGSLLMDIFDINNRKWDNIITAKKGQVVAHTWRGDHKARGKQQLINGEGASITSVAISSCGNFAMIGYKNGKVQLYNLQSGQLRQTLLIKDDNDVLCLGTDVGCTNMYVLARCGELCTYDFPSCRTRNTVSLDLKITRAKLYAEPEWLVIQCDNEDGTGDCLYIYDVEIHSVIRKFPINDKVQDFILTLDYRHLIVCLKGNSIKTWNLEISKVIDVFYTPDVPFSLDCSSNTAFLAFSMKDSRGIHLLVNSMLFGYQPKISCPTILYDPLPMQSLSVREGMLCISSSNSFRGARLQLCKGGEFLLPQSNSMFERREPDSDNDKSAESTKQPSLTRATKTVFENSLEKIGLIQDHDLELLTTTLLLQKLDDTPDIIDKAELPNLSSTINEHVARLEGLFFECLSLCSLA